MPSEATFTALFAELEATKNYRINGSASEALRFEAACAQLLRDRPVRGTHGGRGGEEFTFDHAQLEQQRKDALAFAQAKSSTAGLISLSDAEHYLD